MERAKVYLRDRLAGDVVRLDRGYAFRYDADYLTQPNAEEIALAMPLRSRAYESAPHLHPFFDGLIPEGWMLQIAVQSFGVKPTDRWSLLLATAKAPIGAVRVESSDI